MGLLVRSTATTPMLCTGRTRSGTPSPSTSVSEPTIVWSPVATMVCSGVDRTIAPVTPSKTATDWRLFTLNCVVTRSGTPSPVRSCV